jgi:uncharacterized protein (TIGR02147 family)
MSVFEYQDYRVYIQDRVKNLHKGGRGVKAKLAEYLGVNSTLISQILSGDKDFTIEQAKKSTDFFGLSKLDSDYFILLVQIQRAGTFDLKQYFIEKAAQVKKESLKLSKRMSAKKSLTDLEKSVFYSSKLYSSIHLFTSIKEGKTLEEIETKFKLTRVRANEIVLFLLNAGFISESMGVYRMEEKFTHLEKGSPFLLNHHTNWRVTAIDKAENLSEEEMMYTGNLSLSRSDFLKVREELVAALQKIIKTVQASPAEELANLNIDLFYV